MCVCSSLCTVLVGNSVPNSSLSLLSLLVTLGDGFEDREQSTINKSANSESGRCHENITDNNSRGIYFQSPGASSEGTLHSCAKKIILSSFWKRILNL